MDEIDRWVAIRDVPGDVLEAVALLLERPAWHRQAACRGMGTGMFFPERGADLRPPRPSAPPARFGRRVTRPATASTACGPV